MKTFDIVYISIRNVLRSPLRFILSALAVAIGTASVILISSIGKGTAQQSDRQFKMLGVDGLCLSVSEGYFASSSAVNIENNIVNVDMAVPFDYVMGSSTAHQRYIKTLIFGTGSEPCKALGIEILYGRDIMDSDIQNCENCVIVGEEYAKAAYERTNIVGKEVKLNINGISDYYTVIGVVTSQSDRFKSIISVDPGSIVYIPYTTMNITQSTKGTKNIAIKLSENSMSHSTSEEILHYIKHTQSENNGYSIQNITSYLQKVSEIIDSASFFITLVGGISLAVAILGVMNSSLAGMDKQKHEIGLLLSIGALESDIRLYILIQSILICLTGGFTGFAISFISGRIMQYIGLIPYSLNIKTVVFTEIITIICGFAAGIIPAFKASAMEPVDALRNERGE